MERTYFLHLIGFPGTGKLTIANAFCEQSNARLIDNHAINNPIFNLVRINRQTKIPEDAWVAIRKIRKTIMDGIASFSAPSLNFVFTNVLAKDDEQDIAIYDLLRQTAEKRGSAYIPVVLTCNLDENKKRITDVSREKHMKMQDADALEMMRNDFTLLGAEHPNAMVLDVTEIQPKDSAAYIRSHVNKVLKI